VKNGTWKRYGATFGGNGVNLETSVCTDAPGYGLGDNLPFQVDHDFFLGGGVINSILPVTGEDSTPLFQGYTADAFSFSGRPMFPLVTDYPGEQSSAAYAAAAIARTTPNRPSVDVVQNVLEIGDIPRTLKVYGTSLIEKLAENYLRYQFGIKPLVKDIARTINWSADVNRRLADYKRLRDTGGLRKTVTLDSLTNSWDQSRVVLQSAGAWFEDSFSTVGHRKIRGHVRYVPSADFSKYSQVEMSAMATRAMFGLEANLSGLWEGLPWSWLIDWYTNVGDLLMQTRNIVPVSVSQVTLIRETTSESVTHGMEGGNLRINPGIVRKVRKERYPASAAFDAHLPLLEASQMGILASLLVMKHKYVSPR